MIVAEVVFVLFKAASYGSGRCVPLGVAKFAQIGSDRLF
jgi:hypothetical protein